MSPTYPLMLDVAGRSTVVVGGGPVAARRARALLEGDALVHVVAPWVCEDLADLVADPALQARISWTARDYAPGDLEGAWLVHTATGDRLVDDAVARDAEAGRVWCVRADDADASSAWVPAVARTDDGIVVAVSGGGDPRRARTLRDAVALLLDTGALPVRRHRTGAGHVALVGGGPGDAGLLTLRGRRLLAQADVVVVDRLAPLTVLDELADDVEVVDVGKTPGRHAMAQEDISALLVSHAQAGRRVVRLKGGDPFVLGRGGEEALHCLAHGVDVEVVPGVTSAVSVPAAAGIPVTHRGVTTSFVVASAHDGGEAALDAVRQAPPEATLVLLMGVTGLATTAAALVAAGRPASTPVAVVERGWSDSQRTTVATLADIAAVAASRRVTSPAVVVVGDVVGLREQGLVALSRDA